MKSVKRILITGGAGFIGSNLTKNLIGQGCSVAVLDDFSTGLSSNLSGLDADVFEGSITSQSLVEKAAFDVDAIVHLAARGSVPRSLRNPRATFAVNMEGTINVCEVARLKSIPVIFSSSSSVYGANTRDKKIENEWLSPLSPYAASKLSGEGTVVSFARSFGIQTGVFRLFNVYGPGQRPEHQYSAVIPKWVWAAIRGEELKVFGDGKTSRDFTYIDDVVRVLSTCVLEERYFDGVINLAFGNPITLLDVIDEIRKLLPNISLTHTAKRQGDIRSSDNGSLKLRELFPEVQPTTLHEGIIRTVEWLNRMREEIEAHPLLVSDD
jgi:UDP-glucose 4-epimerase